MQGEPSSAVPAASRRFRTGSDADVDAYRLEDGRFFLFCHLKDERLAADEAYTHSLAGAFPPGTVVGVGRARKTDEGSTPLMPVWFGDVPAGGELWAVEGDVRFRLEAERVLNPGLFLDQHHNRQRLAELVQGAVAGDGQAEDDGLLNLFSYTGAFSVAARRAGVRRTTSVDVSARYLAWERQNFDANFADDTEEAPRLIRDDARAFLRRAVKKGAKYRFIVIDPPTFSRGDKDVFRVQEHLVPMARDALSCLREDPGAAVLVSTNDARWETNEFFAAIEGLARDTGTKLERGRTPADFGETHALKSAWLIRR